MKMLMGPPPAPHACEETRIGLSARRTAVAFVLVLTRARQGEPVGFWPGGKNCDLTKHLDPHNLVINLTLCGSWAGSTFNADGCPGNCESAYCPCSAFVRSCDVN